VKSVHPIGKLLLVCAAAAALAHASDFTGVYARVDKVVLEPNGDSPERIQVWGVFSLADPGHPNEYSTPARGYLYLKVDRNPQAAEAARNEWNDLKQVAGTREIVAFGVRGNRIQIRKADAKPENPDAYPINMGVHKPGNRTDYPPVRALLDYKD